MDGTSIISSKLLPTETKYTTTNKSNDNNKPNHRSNDNNKKISSVGSHFLAGLFVY